MSDKYWVVGNPIKHSKSPEIHQSFAAQCQQSIEYTAKLLETDSFNDSVAAFFANGGKGMNVTVPFKELAFKLADVLDPFAEQAGAVNTLAIQQDGNIKGFNTDGIGLVADLVSNLKISILNKRVLILGAGGAVRGIIAPILAQNPAEIHIANRTHEKAELLAGLFPASVRALSFNELETKYDLVINGTSASLSGQMINIPDSVVDGESCCYDMMYGKGLTVFNQWATDMGVARKSVV